MTNKKEFSTEILRKYIFNYKRYLIFGILFIGLIVILACAISYFFIFFILFLLLSIQAPPFVIIIIIIIISIITVYYSIMYFTKKIFPKFNLLIIANMLEKTMNGDNEKIRENLSKIRIPPILLLSISLTHKVLLDALSFYISRILPATAMFITDIEKLKKLIKKLIIQLKFYDYEKTRIIFKKLMSFSKSVENEINIILDKKREDFYRKSEIFMIILTIINVILAFLVLVVGK